MEATIAIVLVLWAIGAVGVVGFNYAASVVSGNDRE
jgi:hypothetical protein